jgi:hypothetical protein
MRAKKLLTNFRPGHRVQGLSKIAASEENLLLTTDHEARDGILSPRIDHGAAQVGCGMDFRGARRIRLQCASGIGPRRKEVHIQEL